jgi:5'-methylthioadenosine phosphorylase
MIKIGIIGGSGLDDPGLLKNVREINANTPFGEPSSPLTVGSLGGKEVMILARHGRRHTLPPTAVNYRANIQALKDAGCTAILATTACGSLREEIRRGDLVILDQFIDFTRFRKTTFFESFAPGAENAKHTPMADPFSDPLRNHLVSAAKRLGLRHHEKGTVVTIEGPRFSTRAESNMFRIWGADVINMSIAPEAALANEAGIPYAAVAMSTDYDCWKTDEPPVEWAEVLRIFEMNVENVKRLLLETIKLM